MQMVYTDIPFVVPRRMMSPVLCHAQISDENCKVLWNHLILNRQLEGLSRKRHVHTVGDEVTKGVVSISESLEYVVSVVKGNTSSK